MKLSRLISLASIVVTMLLLSNNSFSQINALNRAEKSNEQFAYIKTIQILEKVAEKGYKSVDLFEKLGDAYYFTNQMKQAQKWYGELMALNEKIDPEYYFRYAQSLKGVEKYDEADRWMAKFKEVKSDDSRANNYISSTQLLKEISENTNDFELKNLSINTQLSDFGTSFLNGQLVFTSARDNGPKYGWNNQPFLNLYLARQYAATQNMFSDIIELPGDVNSRMHESSASFSPDFGTIYFTRNNYFRGRLKKDAENINNLKIFKATFEKGEWKNVEPLPFNSDDYNVSHPFVSQNGKYLFFASDMPGTVGQSDIYYIEINGDGTFGSPKNLGSIINTEGRETFPFIDGSDNLYFASDGHPGLGGLDIFKVENIADFLSNPTSDVVVSNVGKPLNSPSDDFAYFADETSGIGYLSSNRPGGIGDDDIYAFSLNCLAILRGIIVDAETGLAIPNATATLSNSLGSQLEKRTLGKDAVFSFDANCADELLVKGEKEDYLTNEIRINVIEFDKSGFVKIPLNKTKNKVEEGVDLAKILQLNPIYFDFDKAKIRPDAEIELQKIVVAMQQYPELKIDVRSHTDSRGNDHYNLKLSERRNQSTLKYLVEVGGIDASRLTGKGYGETALLNECSNGVSCSQEQHQVNRRSEFIILSEN